MLTHINHGGDQREQDQRENKGGQEPPEYVPVELFQMSVFTMAKISFFNRAER